MTDWKVPVELVLRELERSSLESSATVILIGSVARQAATDRSDVDILILLPTDTKLKVRVPPEVHLQQQTRVTFIQRLQEGDDYPLWAIRYGLPLHDPDRWWSAQVEKERFLSSLA